MTSELQGFDGCWKEVFSCFMDNREIHDGVAGLSSHVYGCWDGWIVLHFYGMFETHRRDYWFTGYEVQKGWKTSIFIQNIYTRMKAIECICLLHASQITVHTCSKWISSVLIQAYNKLARFIIHLMDIHRTDMKQLNWHMQVFDHLHLQTFG